MTTTRGLRVVCRDCEFEREWYPSEDRLHRSARHKHELVTGHRVAYEAVDEQARRGQEAAR